MTKLILIITLFLTVSCSNKLDNVGKCFYSTETKSGILVFDYTEETNDYTSLQFNMDSNYKSLPEDVLYGLDYNSSDYMVGKFYRESKCPRFTGIQRDSLKVVHMFGKYEKLKKVLCNLGSPLVKDCSNVK